MSNQPRRIFELKRTSEKTILRSRLRRERSNLELRIEIMKAKLWLSSTRRRILKQKSQRGHVRSRPNK